MESDSRGAALTHNVISASHTQSQALGLDLKPAAALTVARNLADATVTLKETERGVI